MSGDPQRLILEPLSLPIFVRDTESGLECPLGKSADDMKVSGVVYGLRQGMASRGFWMGWVDGLV